MEYGGRRSVFHLRGRKLWYEAQAALVAAQILTPSYSHALGVWYTHRDHIICM